MINARSAANGRRSKRRKVMIRKNNVLRVISRVIDAAARFFAPIAPRTPPLYLANSSIIP